MNEPAKRADISVRVTRQSSLRYGRINRAEPGGTARSTKRLARRDAGTRTGSGEVLPRSIGKRASLP
jgi:hypothetical protein